MHSINTILNHSELSRVDLSARAGADGWPASRSEHIARLKRRALIQEGRDPTSLALWSCWTPDRRYHVVLAASTEDGDVVLDCLTDEILPMADVPYRWISRLP